MKRYTFLPETLWEGQDDANRFWLARIEDELKQLGLQTVKIETILQSSHGKKIVFVGDDSEVEKAELFFKAKAQQARSGPL